MNKKLLIFVLLSCLLVGVFVAAVLIIFSLYLGKNDDRAAVEKKPGVAVEETKERGGQPSKPAWDSTPVNTSNNGISVRLPVLYTQIASPVIVAGNAVAFENTVSVLVRDERGIIRGRGFATADAPDVGQSGPYKTAVAFDAPPDTIVYVEVFEASAKDGLPIHMVRIPVRTAINFTTVKAFLIKEGEQKARCDIVHAVTRTVPETYAVGHAALDHVLAGPTAEEWQDGYRSIFPPGVDSPVLSIVDGVAYVEFNKAIRQIVGSCAVTAARAQIEKTLQQFPTVSRVVYSVAGESDPVLEP